MNVKVVWRLFLTITILWDIMLIEYNGQDNRGKNAFPLFF